jgi:hypothetical protein
MHSREINFIQKKISQLSLDLRGFTVLTEVGSGLYNYMPVIPLLAGANKVMAWTRDSNYGKASSVIEKCLNLLPDTYCKDNLEFHEGSINHDHLKTADLITNSGFLRPLNKDKLKAVKETAVIPLMFEKWEFRDDDLDLDYCKKKGIKVAGTNESHPKLNVFKQVGHLGAKLAFNAGYEIYQNNIAVWSNDSFGEVISDVFQVLGARQITLTTDFRELLACASELDFIFIADYKETRCYNDISFFDWEEILCKNPSLGFVHLYGDIKYKEFSDAGLSTYPQYDGKAKCMSKTLNYLGINSFFSLMIGGFKVGSCLLNGNFDDDLVQIL